MMMYDGHKGITPVCTRVTLSDSIRIYSSAQQKPFFCSLYILACAAASCAGPFIYYIKERERENVLYIVDKKEPSMEPDTNFTLVEPIHIYMGPAVVCI
jgi:hypothetical protein